MSGLEIKVVDQVVRVSEGMGPPGPPGPGNQIVESGGPTALAVGAIADGQLLRRQGNAIVGESPSVGGTSDHGQLQGLADDDHPQYHTDARGDARYSQLGHNHDLAYEPVGATAAAVGAHVAAPDPHPGYATDADLASGLATKADIGHAHTGVYDPAGTAVSAVGAHAGAAGAHPINGVDGLAAALALLAPLLSPALTGTPTAPTASPGTNSTQIATTGFVAAAIAALLNSAPGALDTLDELAAALGDDPNFATTITNALAGKLAKASNLSDLTDAAAARTNLGAGAVGASIFVAATASAIRALLELGGAALLNVGTTSGTVAAGDDSRFSDARTPTAHTHPLSQIEGSGASAGQVPTWSGTGWLPSTPSGASPAGSGTELQFRNGSAFGAAAGTAWDVANGRLSLGAGASPAGRLHVQSGAASEVGAIVQGAASQTANLQEWRNSAGTVLASVSESSSTGFIQARRFQFSDDPTNRYITSSLWISNAGLELRNTTGDIVVTAGGSDNYKVIVARDTVNLRPIFRSQVGRSLVVQAADADAIANRPVGDLVLLGASCNANGESISGGAIVGANVLAAGGAGASNATGNAHGGHVYLDGGQGYGTGVHGDVIVGNTHGVLRLPVKTVATLPAATTAGRRCFVSDATATTFHSIVAGGGANFVPVFSDGTNWRIG